ncbi:radical SAM protein [Ruminococcus sp. NK3A76]|uniref:radical SAM protein n=1 Tax=Ruminococcus sp. NK3A76 TaxID=877411 RepID=UPI00048E12F1|nr:radical SAM protein [Ruminococcus sp. NK3A76]
MTDHLTLLSECRLCPRQCGIDRTKSKGFCGEGRSLRIARWGRHYWEEPCISGKEGSGTVFFCGCSLKCVFCQNHEISQGSTGYDITESELADIFLKLQDKGANNINLVNPTHFVPQILTALDIAKDRLMIPVVYNCGGYERAETIRLLNGYIDIFLPDLKYYDGELSFRYSKARDYFENAIAAVKEMAAMTGKPAFDDKGIMKKGVIIRHLVLPGGRHDSIKLMDMIGQNFEKDEVLVSLMSQFTPTKNCEGIRELCRRTTTFEYNSVIKALEKYGFEGFIQQRSSADDVYIPQFFNDKKVTFFQND